MFGNANFRWSLLVPFLVALSIFLFFFSNFSVVFADDFQDGVDATARKDYKTAYKFLIPLAEQGHAKAQSILATMYLLGLGGPIDKQKATILRWKAAKQGYVPAYQDLSKPAYRKWLRQIAEKGDSFAQRYIGASFYYGEGVTQDYAEAAKWYNKAAEQGDDISQNILGAMYERGRGIPKNYIEAYKWFAISGERGNKYARMYTEKIGKRKMTPDQVAEALGLVKEWVKKHK